MRVRHALWVGIGVLLGILTMPTVTAQPFNTQIQLAITQLTTGVIPFTNLRNVASAYINWGTTAGVNGYGLRDNAGIIEAKNSGGAWLPLPTSSTLPTAASFITRVSEGSLSNETPLDAIASALLVNTTGTGVPVAYTGTTCTNQFVRALDLLGVATCSAVVLTTDVSGTLQVANGGLGLTAGTSGGVLGFTAAGTLASSAALAVNQLVLGGGGGATPTTLGTLGTSSTVLHGNAAGAPTFSAVNLTTTVTGILPGANGGTSNGFFAVSGPTTSLKTFAFPNASATVLTDNAAVTATQGGTGQTVYVVGDLLQANATTTLARLAATSTGNALISGGVGTISAWGKIGLTTHVSGTLGATNGGTGFAAYTTGDLLYANSGTTLARLAAVATGQVLISQGVGTAPVWSTSPAWTTAVATQTATALTVQQLTSTATNSDPTEIIQQYRVATTDNTITTIGTMAIPTTTTRLFSCSVASRRTGGAAGTAEDGAGYLIQAVYKNVAGVATEIGESDTVVGEDQAGWDTSFASDGAGNALLRVTGATNNNITWHATCRSYALTD